MYVCHSLTMGPFDGTLIVLGKEKVAWGNI
jgi:hypothetical protein